MRFGVFIIALLACEVAHAQTPLPRSRPQDAPARANVHADTSKTSNSKISANVPVPRVRPADAPARSVATAAREVKSEAHASTVPVPNGRPASAAPRVVEAAPKVEPVKPNTTVAITPAPEKVAPVAPPAKQELAKQEPLKQESPKEEKLAKDVPLAPVVSLEGASPVVKEDKKPEAPQVAVKEDKKEEIQTAVKEEAPAVKESAPPVKEETAKVESAPVESPRVVPDGTAVANSASPQVIIVPLGNQRAAPDAGPSVARDDTPIEEPVPPLANPPAAASETKITRLEPRQVPPEVKNAPTIKPDLSRPEPPAATTPPQVDTQVAQLAPALVSLFKKVPVPKTRPLSAWPRPDDIVFRDVTAPSPEAECDAALNSGILVAERLQQLGRRGGCYVPYAVKVDAIMVGRKRIDLVPAAKLRCGFALAIANWVRADFAPAAAALGANFVGLRQLDSYNCRTMSSTKRLMSEHSMGNALDIAEVILAGHHAAHLTNPNTQKAFRYRLRASACKRFKTVLGPGVPQHHDHIHVDLRHHYGPGGICHWNVL